MEVGKISNELLDKIIFSKIKYHHPDVIVGSGLSEDCSLIDFRDEICVISTDPITATASEIGKLAVIVSGNDVATKGVKPFAIMTTLLIPPSAKISEVKAVVEDIIKICNASDIELIGGHTEVTDAVNRIVVSATSLGKGRKNEVVYGRNVEAGDKLILTKFAGCEGTVILFDEFKGKLSKILDDKDIAEIESLRNSLSVTSEGVAAGKNGAKYMHDVTEGGVLGAAWEVAKKYDLGVNLYETKIPLLNSTKKIADYFDIDALKLISSGVMLIAASGADALKIIEELKAMQINANVAGEFVEGKTELITSEGVVEIKPPESDDLYRALKKGENDDENR
ncbi:AIR synthase family protein [Alkalibacter sp. M17DMB]|nr:AIR synthase family protein [Alkalibacter mobilis]